LRYVETVNDMTMSIKTKYRVMSINKEQTKEWLLKKHYARRIPSISYSFGLYSGINLVGVCTYGLPPSDELTKCCGEENKKYCFELNRLIKNDGLEKNTQSWFVSQTFKLLPKPMIIISYSDINNGHNGYTYQSLNFLFTGTGGSTHEYLWWGKELSSRHINKIEFFDRLKLPYDNNLTIKENFEKVGGKVLPKVPKNRYIYFLGDKRKKREFREKLKYEVLPYPKGDNKRYDTSYNTTTQIQLF